MSKVRTVIEGAKIIGKAGAKTLAKVATVVAAHPQASLRVGGILTTASGVKDLVAYSKTRATGTLLKGVAKVAIGAGLTIFNDKSSWYEKFQDVTPAVNAGRPMDPIYVGPFSHDPTIGSVAKMAEVHVNWTGYSQSLAFKTAMNQYLRYTRDILRSNLPYGIDHISQFIVDSIFLTTALALKQRQLTFYRYNPSDFPDFYRIWNKELHEFNNVGLHPLYDVDYVADDNIAETIAKYNAIVDAISGQLVLPYTLSQFINYYFSNLYVADEDGCNAQYLRLTPHTMGCYFGRNEIQFMDVNSLSLDEILNLVSLYNTNYGVVASDVLKAGLVTTIGFLHFEDLDQVIVHDQAILQAIINGYTDNPNDDANNHYIRLDFLPTESDDLTTFLMLGIFNNENDPLYTPTMQVASMEFKFLSNPDLQWDNDLFQYISDSATPEIITRDDFSLVVRTDMTSLHSVNVQASGSNTRVIKLPGTVPEDVVGGAYVGLTNATLSGTPVINPGMQFVSATMKARLCTDSATTTAFEECMNAVASGNNITITEAMNKYSWDVYIPIAQANPSGGSIWYYQKTNRSLKPISYTRDSLSFESANSISMVMAEGKIWQASQVDSEGNPVILIGVSTGGLAGSESLLPGVHQAVGISMLTSLPRVTVSDILTAQEYNLTARPEVSLPNRIVKDITSPETYSPGSYLPIKTTFIHLVDQALTGAAQAVVTTTVSSEVFVPNLAGFIADAFDFHIPMVSTIRNRIVVNGEVQSDTIVGKSMLKEAYVPVFYNTQDLDSILYQMYYSLFMPMTGSFSGNNDVNKSSKKSHKGKPKDRSEKKEEKKGG